jgi:hypothetical protein
MVSDDPRVYGKGGLLDQFVRSDMPRVAISVDMLDTGIDVREIVNLVFAKPVFSYTKFWQMIGRGTRLLESNKIKPWCPKKDVFQIIDCWDNFEYFKVTPKGKEPKPQIPLPVRFAGIRIDKVEAALALGQTSIAEKEIGVLRAQIAALPARSVAIMEAKEQLAKVPDDLHYRVRSAAAMGGARVPHGAMERFVIRALRSAVDNPQPGMGMPKLKLCAGCVRANEARAVPQSKIAPRKRNDVDPVVLEPKPPVGAAKGLFKDLLEKMKQSAQSRDSL